MGNAVIKESLRQALFKINENRPWLAEKMGVTYMTVTRWTKAESMSKDKIADIAGAFDLSYDEFMALDPSPIVESTVSVSRE